MKKVQKIIKNRFNKIYIKYLLFIDIILFIFLYYIYGLSKNIFIFFIIFVIIYIFLQIIFFIKYRKNIIIEFVKFFDNYNKMLDILQKNIDNPFAILTEKGFSIIFANDAFLKTFDKNIGDVFQITNYSSKFYLNDHEYIKVNKKIYRIEEKILNNKTNKEFDLKLIYFYDETNFIKIKDTLDNEKLVNGLIYFDNYDNIINALEESKILLFNALINEKLIKYFSKYNSIIKKLDDDKYFVIFKNADYKRLVEDNFSILNIIKKIDVGQDIKPSISIGIGKDGESYLDNNNYSRYAIDMALSRGGDQVVVKSKNKINYFGGNTEGKSSSSTVKVRMIAELLKESILKTSRIIILGHLTSDFDSIGASIGLYRIAKNLGTKANIVIDKTSTQFRKIINDINESNEYELNLFINSFEAKNILSKNKDTLLIIVDVNNYDRVQSKELLEMTNNIIVIDHHRKQDKSFKNIKFDYIDPYSSSTSEMVTELIMYIEDNIKLTKIEAEALYSGIMLDTNNFLIKTGVRTFKAASFLKKFGVDLIKIKSLFKYDKESYKIKLAIMKNAEIYKDKYIISSFSFDDIEFSVEISPTALGAKVANDFLEIKDIEASFVLICVNNDIYISARSIGDINVQILMEKLGGGGHFSVAGAWIKNKTLNKTENLLKYLLDKEYKE